MTNAATSDNKRPLLRGLVEASGLFFVSGQGPKDSATGQVVGTDPGDQTRKALSNISDLLASAGLGLRDIVRTTVYLTDARHYGAINDAYREFFEVEPPARTSLVVAGLANPTYLVEVDAIAYRTDGGAAS